MGHYDEQYEAAEDERREKAIKSLKSKIMKHIKTSVDEDELNQINDYIHDRESYNSFFHFIQKRIK